MHPGWGVLMAAIGVFFLVSATRRSEALPYRLFVARSRSFWGENVHRFHQFVGLALIVVGLSYALR